MIEPSAPMPVRKRVALMAACLAVQAVVLAAAPLLFSNDGPQHLLSAYMYAHPEHAVADWVVVNPVTDNGYRQVFWVIDALLGWRRAHLVAAALPLVVALAGWLALATQERQGATARAALLTAVSIPWHYWIGLLPFLYATAFVPFVYMLIRDGRRTSLLLSSLLMMFQASCHPFPVMVAGAVFFVTRPTVKSAAAVALTGIPAACVALIVAKGSIQAEGGGVVWDLEPDVFRQFFSQYMPGLQAFRVFLFVSMVALMFSSWRQRARLSRERRAMLLVATLLIVATPLLPFSANGWELVRARLLPTGFPLLVAFAPIPVGGTAAMTTVFAVYGAIVFGWIAQTASELNRAYNDIYDGLEKSVKPLSGLVWQLDIFETELAPDPIPEIDAYGGTAHMAQVLAITKLGQPNFTQATDEFLHGVIYKRKLKPRPGAGEQELGEALTFWGRLHDNMPRRQLEMTSYFAHGYPADVLIAAGLSRDGDALRAAGYQVTEIGTTAAGLSLFEARFVGCSVEIVFEAAVDDVVEIGVLPLGGAVDVFPVSAGRNVIQLEQEPCGTWWVRGEHKIGEQPLHHAVVQVDLATLDVALAHSLNESPDFAP